MRCTTETRSLRLAPLLLLLPVASAVPTRREPPLPLPSLLDLGEFAALQGACQCKWPPAEIFENSIFTSLLNVGALGPFQIDSEFFFTHAVLSKASYSIFGTLFIKLISCLYNS